MRSETARDILRQQDSIPSPVAYYEYKKLQGRHRDPGVKMQLCLSWVGGRSVCLCTKHVVLYLARRKRSIRGNQQGRMGVQTQLRRIPFSGVTLMVR